MDLNRFVESLRRDLLAAAAAGTDETRRTADLLVTAVDPAVRLTIVDAISAAAADVTAALPGVTVDVRMRGREPWVSVDIDDPEPSPEPSPAPDPVGDEAGTARVTLRLPESVKARTEEAAGRAGISVNAWLVRAVTAALDEPAPRRRGGTGRRLTGYARG